MDQAYQSSNTNGSSFFEGDIIRLKKSQMFVHQELKGYQRKSYPKRMNLHILEEYNTQLFQASC
jgi:hypothetical protein